MHPYSPAMSELVAAEAMTAARRAGRVPVDPAELERYSHSALRELMRSRPRITDYVPQLALNQVLTWLDLRRRLVLARTPAKPPTGLTSGAVAAAAADRCRSRQQHCWAVTDGASGRDLCRCSGRTPDASAWNARLPWRNVVRRMPTAA